MERHQLIEAMTGLKLYGMRASFDEIAGSVHLERGSAYARDLRMNGPAAKIRMSGVVDLERETQNLRLHIQPRLEDTVAVAGALIGELEQLAFRRGLLLLGCGKSTIRIAPPLVLSPYDVDTGLDIIDGCLTELTR